MSLRTSANRYAKALFDVALAEKNDLAQVDRDLEAVVAMMHDSPDLAQAAGRPGVTDAARTSLIELFTYPSKPGKSARASSRWPRKCTACSNA